jgi:hypothetical protein
MVVFLPLHGRIRNYLRGTMIGWSELMLDGISRIYR